MTGLHSLDLSVVIPVYNEAGGIQETIRRVEAFLNLKKIKWELILVDDGSKDNTQELILESLAQRPGANIRLLTSEKNNGKGFGCR